jgi:hypothetical protein
VPLKQLLVKNATPKHINRILYIPAVVFRTFRNQLKFTAASGLILFICLHPLNAQSFQTDSFKTNPLYAEFERIYGFNHELINGVQFYNKYFRIQNHPYFQTEKSHLGSVTIDGKKFSNLLLNYNIYEQTLTHEYSYFFEGLQKIILNMSSVDAFTLEDHFFEKLNLNGTPPLFYQVIRSEGLTCHIHWDKTIITNVSSSSYVESFSDPRRTYYLGINNQLLPFKNARTFLDALPANSIKQVKKYLRHKRIKFSKASPHEIKELLDFISSTLSPDYQP